ncbi:Beta-galactosidase-1-like protein 2 [Channa argus]|uniref:Beta-galactosidase-1-like protein 2 n=1 Tax=Channa argus TaxID=215402 RepID=A0A6G1PRZ6_CHAAH|nr:Beta-galactosidase-1-like protein 2 [Channa argus]
MKENVNRSRTEVRKNRHVVGLRANSSQFTLETKPFRILGGSIHYFRVPRAYWMDRLQKMKACGLNTVTTYVPWNLHEPERGVFNFEDQLDLEAYLRLAASLGLWVILRPGPYICAEWDLGGLPSWLLRDKNMRLRTTYPGFTAAVNTFFDQLIKKVVPHQYSRGGPVIAVQVENEYGSYAKDKGYMHFIKEALLSRGITELLLTSDNKEGLKLGGVKGDMVSVVTEILKQDISINLYMFHGGTNFGFMNGALAVGLPAPKPMVTSYAVSRCLIGEHSEGICHSKRHRCLFLAPEPAVLIAHYLSDYDAPLSEAGDYTTKYHLLRNVFSRYHTQPLPELPSLRDKSAYQPVLVHRHLSLWDTLHFTDKPLKSERPVNMENLPVNNKNGQSYGYTLYETTITSGGALNSRNNIRDRALVFVDKHFVGVLDYKIQELALPDGKGKRTLSLLVENCGRVNYGKTLDEQRKGLVGDIELNQQLLRDFIIRSLDMKPGFVNRLGNSAHWVSVRQRPSFPGFFQARLYVSSSPKDIFIKLPGWNKGVVFINGKNLGRYWSIGPQQTLYVPGPWLRRGDNQVIVFEEQETDAY